MVLIAQRGERSLFCKAEQAERDSPRQQLAMAQQYIYRYGEHA